MRTVRAVTVGSIAVLLSIAAPGDVRADSDANFCIGPDYVAYNLRGWNWYTGGRHLLYVASFSGDDLRLFKPVDLGVDLQVHAMDCSSGAIVIQGWGSNEGPPYP